MKNTYQVIRKKGYWIYDFVFGNKIKTHYKDIDKTLSTYHAQDSIDRRAQLLEILLSHSVSTTVFYKKYTSYTSIKDFPVINKNQIRDNYDDFKSTLYTAKNTITVTTSGSTGAPFSIIQNNEKQSRNRADILFFTNKTGYEIGNQLLYLKIWPEVTSKKSVLGKWLQNIMPHSIFNLEDEDIQKLITKITTNKERKSFLAYASGYEKICRYLDTVGAAQIDANIGSIISMSERLNEYTRTALQKYFGVAAVSRYSSSENGVIAQETSAGKFEINWASYHVEIFDLHKDIPVPLGTHGRIMITDLFNYANPLIRYDIGDIGMMKLDENKVPYLAAIEGRKLDVLYDTQGNVIPSHLSYKLCKYGEFKQFQLIQSGKKEYQIKLNTDTAVDEIGMLYEFKGYFGEDATITIIYVDEIPLLASGKRREVVNTYYAERNIL